MPTVPTDISEQADLAVRARADYLAAKRGFASDVASVQAHLALLAGAIGAGESVEKNLQEGELDQWRAMHTQASEALGSYATLISQLGG